MTAKRINPLVQWWATPKLPPEDILARHNFISQWLTHPIKRRLARVYLTFLQKYTDIVVIGITGSTGKTTTTEILYSILNRIGKTVKSAEGIDPVYNIPNTILKAGLKTKYLVLEMSVEYKNEMDYYLWLAKPDIGVVTNISFSHTQFLDNTEGVACEKGKLIESLHTGGFAVLNKEDRLACAIGKKTKAKIVYFGQNADVSALNIRYKQDSSTCFTLKIGTGTKNINMHALGKQFVNNALGAAAVANVLGVDLDEIGKGIESFKPPKHRLNVRKSLRYGLVFDDTYNSNPKALGESLDTFKIAASKKVKIAVIGDMLELGEYEESFHRELGKKVGIMKFELVVGVGNSAKFIVEEASRVMGSEKCYLAKDYSEALDIVKPFLNKNTALFVKGSRSIHLDKLVEALI